ncbi:MAG: MYXO-CTERM sorting domain-containing protein, partial [Planctomycetota bacterium]
EGLRDACGRCGATPAEACDGIDQDCDGVVDEAASCPDDGVCFEGRCAAPCRFNECPASFMCVDGLCLTACEADGCDADTAPDPAVDPACADVRCASGEFCRGGVCVPSCAAVACPLFEVCVDGACAPDPCGGVACLDGQACAGGGCVDDPCAGVSCEGGARCSDGACVPDVCSGVVCRPGEICQPAQGLAQCIYRPLDDRAATPDAPDGADGAGGDAPTDGPTGDDLLPGRPADEGGAPGLESSDGARESGCNCEAGATTPPHLLALLVLLGLRRRRETP